MLLRGVGTAVGTEVAAVFWYRYSTVLAIHRCFMG